MAVSPPTFSKPSPLKHVVKKLASPFDNLKTSTANDFVRTEKFFESKAYEMVMKELKLK